MGYFIEVIQKDQKVEDFLCKVRKCLPNWWIAQVRYDGKDAVLFSDTKPSKTYPDYTEGFGVFYVPNEALLSKNINEFVRDLISNRDKGVVKWQRNGTKRKLLSMQSN